MKGLTVGLPLFRSKNIAWLAMESLCSQVGIDFDWELLIVEENGSSAFGRNRIKKYIPSLREVGCNRIEYYGIETWKPLGKKWKHMSEKSGNTLGFLLQAADCYSQPHRLKETHDLFAQDPNVDWVQSKKGYFYNIENENVVTFDHDLYTHPCSLNMAIRTDLMKLLPHNDRKSSVDSWIYQTLSDCKKEEMNISFNESDNWKLGVDTQGLNIISRDRANMIDKIVPPFVKTEAKIEDIVPTKICKLLKNSKEFIDLGVDLRKGIYHEV